MKILSSNTSTITVSRRQYEWTLNMTVRELSRRLLPLASRIIKTATLPNAVPNSPESGVAFALYGTIFSLWTSVVRMTEELAKEEPKFKAAYPLLGLDASPESKKSPHLYDIDVTIQQWRLNLQKFILSIDPDSTYLKMHHDFDPYPPTA